MMMNDVDGQIGGKCWIAFNVGSPSRRGNTLMRLTQVVSTSALSFLLTTTALVYAQDQREEARPAEESRPEATKPAQDEAKSPRQEEAKPDKQEKRDERNRSQEKQDKNAKQDENRSGKQADRAEQSGQQAQRGSGGHSARIPDDKFRSHFGRQHTFAVHQTTVQGQPGFQYGGYSFIIVEAWPAGWAYTDDCYIDYVDGEYFLFDLLHPGVQIALTVVM
jgi:hypothetical protein